ncbi:sensor histidine kinase [Phenylobacterium hankyongense]|uniref:histidine kinase n=1 Tax=Phenylobacterium hankyongense TaxID=1813876 RepID=A0A328AWD5_9CAUL|nr:GAF domain-containing sensor histidine kinase [Phenylobacterium hankyongense]RAK58555.1 sensor histidine kinase [Phenylobacterium hankyongense]
MDDPVAEDVARIARIEVIPKILEVICRTTGMGFAAVARVTDDRWVACAVRDEIDFGLVPGGELEVQTTICSEIRDSGQAVVIDHVAKDNAFRGHPTAAQYGFQSYISVPISRQGAFFGTLCAIDPRPARLKAAKAQAMFELYAELIAFHLEAEERLSRSEAALLNERQTAELREQFIAVLGHDLRNPLASIDAGGRLLLRTELDEEAVGLVRLVQSSVQRMAGLIDNLLDFARGRLGGGIDVELHEDPVLASVLEQIVAELQAAHPERLIDVEIDLRRPVPCDPRRIAQLFSNLLANALTHGSQDVPVGVQATTEGGRFVLSVTNGGQPIPASAMARLFEPFSRPSGRASQQGLGLGLYIAAEIARAHGGLLDVASDPGETRFTFSMPLAGAAATDEGSAQTPPARPDAVARTLVRRRRSAEVLQRSGG